MTSTICGLHGWRALAPCPSCRQNETFETAPQMFILSYINVLAQIENKLDLIIKLLNDKKES